MGAIQTALGQLLGAAGAAVGAGRKIHEKAKGQALQKEEVKAATETAEKAEQKEASAIATEADLRMLGASPDAAKAYRLAQERGTASPKRIVFDEKGKPLATYEEIAELLAGDSLGNTFTSRLRSKNAVAERKKILEGKTHEERVENAILSEKGAK